MGPIQFPAHIAGLKPYVPGPPIEHVAAEVGMSVDRIVKLASNENPLGASPRALEALAAAAIDVSRYSDPDVAKLTAALAAHHDIPGEWVVAGAGSESVIGMVASVLLHSGRSAVYSQYSFQSFPNAAQRSGASSIVVPSPNHVVDLAGLRDAIRVDTAVVYIANPGNPTGTLIPFQEIVDFLEAVPPRVVVLLDEAYFEYVPTTERGDSIALVRRHPNLIVTRTFSKAYGLAGLRVGYGICQPQIADTMRRVRAPFSVTQAAETAAIAAMCDTGFLDHTIASNATWRTQLERTLRDMELESLPSVTNFVLARVGSGKSFAARLRMSGVIVRPVDNYGLPEWVRISVGDADDLARLASAMAEARQFDTSST